MGFKRPRRAGPGDLIAFTDCNTHFKVCVCVCVGVCACVCVCSKHSSAFALKRDFTEIPLKVCFLYRGLWFQTSTSCVSPPPSDSKYFSLKTPPGSRNIVGSNPHQNVFFAASFDTNAPLHFRVRCRSVRKPQLSEVPVGRSSSGKCTVPF